MTDVDSAVAELALFIEGVRYEDIAEESRRRASFVIADTLGVMLRGSATPDAGRLFSGGHTTGDSSTIAPGFPLVSVEDATLFNAVSACSTELDEGTRPTGHPAIHILPPVLAVTQKRRDSGRRFLAAFMIGYEVQARLQRAARLRDRVHCHGNYGNVGVAAALSWLRGANAQQITCAMNGAATFASATSYSLPYAGATIHSAAPAMSGLAGLTVDRLVRMGFTAYSGTVGEVFGSILGDRFNAPSLTEDLGDSWAVDSGYVKFHSTCGHVHPVVDSLINAVGVNRQGASRPWELGALIDPQTVERVLVWVSPRAYELSGLPREGSSLAARFSIPFSVATTLVHGSATASAFEGRALEDARIRALAERVVVKSDPYYDEVFPTFHRARVEIFYRDGQVAYGECHNPYGNPENRASDDDIRFKFGQLVSHVLSEREVDPLWSSIMNAGTRISMRGFPLPEQLSN